jgi:orotate phosphoribosyltransferase
MSTNLLDILQRLGAVLTNDHFVYTSGKHGEVYINKDALYPHTRETSQVGRMLAELILANSLQPEVVVGPALGGIILSQWTAYHLSELLGKEVLSVYTEKDDQKNQVFTRNYDQLVAGKKVVVVEDIVTTAGSLKKTLESVRQAQGLVEAAVVMVNRNPEVTDELVGTKFLALANLPAEAWDESEIPDWLRARPINTKVGHGKKYLQSKGLL